jgi:tmRNA-binding protein
MKVNIFERSRKQAVLIFFVLAVVSVCFTTYRVIKLVNDPGKATLVVYDGPNLIKESDIAKISVQNTKLFVYNSPVNNTHTWVDSKEMPVDYVPMSYFDFDGKVKVKIKLDKEKDLKNVVVRPLSAGINPKVSGNTISFTVKDPGQYSIEYNNDVKNTVFLFANPLETQVPDKNDKNGLYLGPGLWDIGTISLENDQTLYISGGAVVYGTAYASEAKNIAVKGRGIIDGSKNPGWLQPGSSAKVPINFNASFNVTVDGIILMNPNAWTLNCLSCTNGKINNVKIISSRQNGDGITLQSCDKFNISNSFVRSWDDSIVVKNYESNTDQISFDNMVIWTDLAQSCEIGYETNKGDNFDSKITNVSYNNISIIHNFHKPAISIHNSDNALVQNISYNNIVVEDASMGQGDAGANNQLIDFTIMKSGWTTTKDRGHIKDVSLNNIKVLSGKSTATRMLGFDKEHKIENVTISGLEILGQEIKSAKSANLTKNDFVSNVEFK